jgi:hypothetical protein
MDGLLTPTLIAVGTALLAHYYITQRSRNSKHPPGPLCVPILGSLPMIMWFGGKLSKLFEYSRRHYGDVSIACSSLLSFSHIFHNHAHLVKYMYGFLMLCQET